MSTEDRLVTPPKVSGAKDEGHTPLPEAKQASLRKRLEERVALEEGQYSDNGDIQGYCPMHEDVVASNKPSARFNPVYGFWVCFAPRTDLGCAEAGSKANLEKMLRKLKGNRPAEPNNVRPIGSAKSARKRAAPEITEKQALEYCNNLQKNPGALAALEQKRLWDAETVAVMGIGIVDGYYMDGLNNKPRISIPVYDADGKYVACRIYDAFGNRGSGGNKFFWSGGEAPSKDAILRPSRRKSLGTRVVIMEGEPDAILAQQDFRDSKDQIDFVSGTRGSKKPWPTGANSMLANRDVYICLDNDEAGDIGAEKTIQALKVGHKVQNIYLIRIPGRKGVKDWTDYRRGVVKSGDSGRKAMLGLMEDAELKYSRSAEEADAAKRAVSPTIDALSQVSVSDAGTLPEDSPGAWADINVLGRSDGSYLIPTHIELTCARDKGAKCDACPLGEAWEGQNHGEAKLRYYPHEGSTLGMIEASDEQKDKKWRKDSGAKCPDFQNKVLTSETLFPYLVEDHKPKDEENYEPIQRVMFFIGTGDVDAASVQRVAYNRAAFWKDSRMVLFAWDAQDQGSDLDNFVMSEASDRRLRKVMNDGSRVADKLYEIAHDYANNVTEVFGRPLLHVLVDLVYHSVLWMPFERQKRMKGWLDVMVMGDSHTGKSQTTRGLARFYGHGETVNGGSTSRSGLLAGMAPSVANSKFMFAKKGALPRNHKGMLTIEESHKLALKKNEGIIAQMADARDNGEFNLQMIGDIKAPAATRLLWVANPPNEMSRSSLSEFAYGAAEAISMMMGGRENVTRLTLAMGVSSEELGEGDERPGPQHEAPARFSSKQTAMRDLVIWAWSRKPEQIQWGEGAEELVRELSDNVAQKYSDDFPIAMRQDFYAKLARVAASIAARVYSSPDGETLLIRRKHVQCAAKLVEEVLNQDSLGLKRMSAVGVRAEQRQIDHHAELVQKLVEKGAHGVCSAAMNTQASLDVNSLTASTGMHISDVQELMEIMSRGSFLRTDGRKVRGTRRLQGAAEEAQLRLDRFKAGQSKDNKPKSARGKVTPPVIKG